jgi:hypothetical protein
MLKPILELGKVEASGLIDYLYEIFHRDFVQRQAMLGGSVWIDPRSDRKDLGKEETFWHLITRGKAERFPDYRRAERLEWVRQLIESPRDPCVKLFYHKESNPKQDIRLYLWAEAHDFVVIIQRLGRTRAFLVTSFYVDQRSKRDDYRKRLAHFESGKDPALSSHAWF